MIGRSISVTATLPGELRSEQGYRVLMLVEESLKGFTSGHGAPLPFDTPPEDGSAELRPERSCCPEADLFSARQSEGC
jgi:hypothetical protein